MWHDVNSRGLFFLKLKKHPPVKISSGEGKHQSDAAHSKLGLAFRGKSQQTKTMVTAPTYLAHRR
jgi:hypothetical protein